MNATKSPRRVSIVPNHFFVMVDATMIQRKHSRDSGIGRILVDSPDKLLTQALIRSHRSCKQTPA